MQRSNDVPDPLSVLATARRVVDAAVSVRIDPRAIDDLAERIARRDLTPAEWESDLHWSDGPDATANFILVLDALNFCFWGEPRWVVTFQGNRYNGYSALAAALTRALNEGVPLTDAAFLATIDDSQLAAILAGEYTIPLLHERAINLREVGRILQEHFDGQFSTLIRAVNGSAITLVRRVVDTFSSFRDVATYAGSDVFFYKRAQILASDLHGAFNGSGLGAFHDLDQLTAFADYKVPQVLRALGALNYETELSRLIEERVELPAGSEFEVEIRAATIWAVEELRRALLQRGLQLPAYQLDWTLWQLGQNLPASTSPYHRTRTIYY
jgi:hypothetical protein